MNPDERILLLIAGAGLAAVVLWRVSEPLRVSPLTVETGGTPIQAAGYSQVPSPAQLANGPDYLIANAPWAYNPAIGNVVPTITVGQAGQVENNPPNFNYASDCGC